MIDPHPHVRRPHPAPDLHREELVTLPLPPLPIELFSAERDAARHAGRASVCRAVLEMTPTDGREPLLPGPIASLRHPASVTAPAPGDLRVPPGALDGVFWAVQSASDVTLAIRTASFATELDARRDAVELLARASDLELLTVDTGGAGASSFWVLLDDRLVMVAGQRWRREFATAGRHLRRSLTHLSAQLAGRSW